MEGTCSKRSVAQIEACAAKAEREWKEWEKETEIPKNEKTYKKTYRKNVYKYNTRQNKATWKFEMMDDRLRKLFVSTETQELRTARSEDAMSHGCPVSGGVPKIAP